MAALAAITAKNMKSGIVLFIVALPYPSPVTHTRAAAVHDSFQFPVNHLIDLFQRERSSRLQEL
jgi:hypothetical protein